MAFLSKYCFFAFLALFVVSHPHVQAQIKVESGKTAEELVTQYFANETVKIRNVHFRGNPKAIGGFTSQNGKPHFEEGFLLTTGLASTIAGPNQSAKLSHVNSTPGDRMLDDLSRNRTFDGTAIEFDFMCSRDSISLKFFFASDEYNESVGNTFGDVTGIWVTGPGLGQGLNLAKMPDGKFVGVNGVNVNTNAAYYVDNNPYNLNGNRLPELEKALDQDILQSFQYDGMTKVIASGLRVKPKEVYHLKIAIADVGDGQIDSGVFLQGGSFVSEEQLWRIRLREEREAKRIADSLAYVQFVADSLARIAFVADSLEHVAFVADSLEHAAFVADSLAQIQIDTDSLEQPPREEPRKENLDDTRGPELESSPEVPLGDPNRKEKGPGTVILKEPDSMDILPTADPNPETTPVAAAYPEADVCLIRFAEGSSRISEEDRTKLREMAARMEANTALRAGIFVWGEDDTDRMMRLSAVKYYFIGAAAPETSIGILENTIPDNPPKYAPAYAGEVCVYVRMMQP